MSTRSVHTDALATLGTAPLPPEAARDAIHIAVEPVVAGEILLAGDHVTVTNGVAYMTTPGKSLGIVDPFLTQRIYEGERFWFLMYPRMVTSLRHVWAHPAFPDEAGVEAIAPADDPVEISRKWIEAFAASIEQTYNRLMDAAQRWVDFADYTYDNSESYKEHWDKFPEFWDHYEVVTGRKFEGERDSFFTCSC